MHVQVVILWLNYCANARQWNPNSVPCSLKEAQNNVHALFSLAHRATSTFGSLEVFTAQFFLTLLVPFGQRMTVIFGVINFGYWHIAMGCALWWDIFVENIFIFSW